MKRKVFVYGKRINGVLTIMYMANGSRSVITLQMIEGSKQSG